MPPRLDCFYFSQNIISYDFVLKGLRSIILLRSPVELLSQIIVKKMLTKIIFIVLLREVFAGFHRDINVITAKYKSNNNLVSLNTFN